MTSDGHVDIDLLADYIGGALEGPEEAAVARRIAEDSRWRETYELLIPGMAAVSAELTALGAEPEPMPGDLAARLDATLASSIGDSTVIDPARAAPGEPRLVPVRNHRRHLSAVPDPTKAAPDPTRAVPDPTEPAPDATRPVPDATKPVPNATEAVPEATDITPGATGTTPGAIGTTPGDGGRRARGRRRLRWAAPAAAAAAVLAFAGFGIDYLAGRSAGTDTTSSAAGGADQAAPMAASGLVSALPQNRITASGADYTDPALQADAAVAPGAPAPQSRTDQEGASAGTPMVTDLDDPALQRLRAPEALRACLQAIARENGGSPIAVDSVDYARYRGAPALIVRFTAGGARWAWATGPDCGTPGRGADVLRSLPVG